MVEEDYDFEDISEVEESPEFKISSPRDRISRLQVLSMAERSGIPIAPNQTEGVPSLTEDQIEQYVQRSGGRPDQHVFDVLLTSEQRFMFRSHNPVIFPFGSDPKNPFSS
jgi:hypothetical protein